MPNKMYGSITIEGAVNNKAQISLPAITVIIGITTTETKKLFIFKAEIQKYIPPVRHKFINGKKLKIKTFLYNWFSGIAGINLCRKKYIIEIGKLKIEYDIVPKDKNVLLDKSNKLQFKFPPEK